MFAQSLESPGLVWSTEAKQIKAKGKIKAA
jgi:hypothetical protein